MSDQRSPDTDSVVAHLRPGQHQDPPPEAERRETANQRIPWEGLREGGSANAFLATLWRFVSAPAAAYTAVPLRGGVWRPLSFALLCGAMFGVISQVLLRAKDGQGRVAALEIMVGTGAVANLIRENKLHQIPSIIQTGKKDGMQLLDQHILEHLVEDRIDAREAYLRAHNKEAFKKYLDEEPPALEFV